MNSKEPYLQHFSSQLIDQQLELSSNQIETTKAILKILGVKKIQREHLEGICFQGIPDNINGLRSLCWKVLLEYLPSQPCKWNSTLQESRQCYEEYIYQYFLPLKKLVVQRVTKYEGDPLGFLQNQKVTDPFLKEGKNDLAKNQNRKLSETKSCIPLQGSKSDTSRRNSETTAETKSTLIEDKILWDDITKDARRTKSGLDFFQKPAAFPLKQVYNKESNKAFEKETHMETLSRILFIYGKLHPDLGYVQGMNEILAPIYYCFNQDQNPDFLGHAEADSFFCFSKIMMDLKGSFMKAFDEQEGGIQARIKSLNEALQRTDKQVWEYLEKYSVNPQFYSLRWLMLLLTQEFEMNQILRLWDRLISHPKRLIYLNYVCLAMIQQVKKRIIVTEEFALLMDLLQTGTLDNFDKILQDAFKLYKLHSKEDEIIHHVIFPI